MVIQLADGDTSSHPGSGLIGYKFDRYINAVRIRNIPLVSGVIASALAVFLFKLMAKYRYLYTKSLLITIIITNVVLYGILETLAQSILNYDSSLPWVLYNTNAIEETIELPPPPSPSESVNDSDLGNFLEYLESGLARDPAPVPFPVSPLTNFKFHKLARFMLWGAIIANAQFWWYKFLQIYAGDLKFVEVLRKVLADQLCYSPVSLASFFLYAATIIDGGNLQNGREKLAKLYLPTLLTNYVVWIPVQFINFLLVPSAFQVPFSSSVLVFWNCYLSVRNSTS